MIRGVLAAVMVLCGVLSFVAFFDAPNFHNLREFGVRWMVDRALGQPLEGVVFILEPLLGLGSFALAWALLKKRGGKAVLVLASIAAGLVALGAVLMAVLGAAAAAAGGSH